MYLKVQLVQTLLKHEQIPTALRHPYVQQLISINSKYTHSIIYEKSWTGFHNHLI